VGANTHRSLSQPMNHAVIAGVIGLLLGER
jgi:hypothetical protein